MGLFDGWNVSKEFQEFAKEYEKLAENSDQALVDKQSPARKDHKKGRRPNE